MAAFSIRDLSFTYPQEQEPAIKILCSIYPRVR